MQSVSSSRLDSGKSSAEPASRWTTAGRQISRIPGVATGTAKPIAKGFACSVSGSG